MNCLIEEETQKKMEDFHKGDCGGHLYWKTIKNKILRVDLYWPSFFVDVYKRMGSCQEC